LRICALLTSRPSSVAQLLRAFPVEQAGVVALLNGCALLGCLRDAPIDLLSAPVTYAEATAREDSTQQMPRFANTRSEVRSSAITERIAQARRDALPKSASQKSTAQGFTGFLGKLRAALTFSPRANP
jgi:hypothetical protein